MTNEELAERIKNGETERITELWDQVYKLIHMRAEKWLNGRESVNGYSVDDLMQTGFFAFLKAIEYFEPGKGLSFVSVLWFQLSTAFRLALQLNRNEESRDPLNRSTSLDNQIGDNNAPTFEDMVIDESATQDFHDIENLLTHKQLQAVLYPILDSLKMSEQEVIYCRYWLGMSCREIAPQYNISFQRINMIEKTALKHIVNHPDAHRLSSFVNVSG